MSGGHVLLLFVAAIPVSLCSLRRTLLGCKVSLNRRGQRRLISSGSTSEAQIGYSRAVVDTSEKCAGLRR